MNIRKPMLASKVKDLALLKYPLFASPKFDGIRALTIDGILLSRTFKPIPNDAIRKAAEGLPNNLDGELILDDGSVAGAHFGETTGAVMRKDGVLDVKYYVFDYVKDSLAKPFVQRQKDLMLAMINLPTKAKAFIVLVEQKLINNAVELLTYEHECLANGYEGIMVRGIDSPYKEGRSTENEGYLLKLKRFEDSEAIVLGFEEKMHNANEREEDAFGRGKRSQAKGGLVPVNTLGKLLVRDMETGIEFEVGTGFDDTQRYDIWHHKSNYLNRIIKYKHQLCGAKDKPRFPVFLGFRDKKDM